ncbi:MAG: hypothetical protein FWE25_02995 [Lachnospiraceae bacterium]|nr:hypothetical protein [Lachnospiraceae bacterium]
MDKVTKIKTEFRLQQWANNIQECQQSGQSIKSWCKDNNIKEHTYYYYLKSVDIPGAERAL